jgi:PIN domain nuclease of toxin-antitoxin system
MEVVLDSHTLFRLLTDSPKLSKLAKKYRKSGKNNFALHHFNGDSLFIRKE